MGAENRKHERIRTGFLVRVTVPIGGDIHEGTCLNLSETGLFVQMLDPLPKGTEVNIELHLKPVDRVVHVDGVVIWTRPKMPDPRFPAGAGMKFDLVPTDVLVLIRESIAEQKKRLPDLPPFRKQEP
ncbi:MAG: PilZ domain-containing protein [Planctomycetota bacterium]|nr:PilZ domain-containing protein [Planctomycetota bacterium]